MIQQNYAPMDIGEVEGEVEGSDDQIDESKGTRRPRRRREVDTSRRTREAALESGRHEKREADNGQDNVQNQKKQKRALVCYNCGGNGHPARLCTTPSDHASRRRRMQAVNAGLGSTFFQQASAVI